MMYEDNLLAGRGLKLMFFSQLIYLVAALLGDNLLGNVLSLISIAMSIGALNVASPSHPLFGRAFWASILKLVINGLMMVLLITDWTGLLLGLTIFGLLLGVYVVYLVCTAAGQLLTVNGYTVLAAKGRTVWKVYLVCSIVLVCFMGMALLRFMVIVATMVLVGTAVAALVGVILYLMFLNNAYHALLGPEGS